MATYSQWKESKKVSQVTWIYGTEIVLKEEILEDLKILIGASSFDYESHHASSLTEASIWLSCKQRSIGEDAPRVVLIRQADSLTDWFELEEWLTDWKKVLPNTYLVFMATDDPPISSLRAPKAVLIKCNSLNKEDMIVWVKRNSGLSDSSAKILIEYCNGNLEDMANLCRVVSAVSDVESNVTLTSHFLASITDETASSFVDALVTLDKPRALSSIFYLTSEDKYKIISLLDIKLTQIFKLKTLLNKKLSLKEIAATSGIPFNVIKELLPSLKLYNDTRIAQCRKFLSLVDSYQQSGIETGILEALVASW